MIIGVTKQRWPVWPALAVIALWWPGRVISVLDGIPFTNLYEGTLLGLFLPLLCCLSPAVFSRSWSRVAIALLLGWKAATTASVVQDGWCVRMMPEKPYVWDQTGAPHSWDVRADWRSPDPKCSALMTHGYRSNEQFPVWFLNLSPRRGEGPTPDERPPLARTLMSVEGVLHLSEPGIFTIARDQPLEPRLYVDATSASPDAAVLAPGSHSIRIETLLTGERWRFEPLLNDTNVWSVAVATVTRPSPLDLAVRPWSRWVFDVLVAGLLLAWFASYLRVIERWIVVWALGAGAMLALCPQVVPPRYWHFVVAGLGAVALARVRPAPNATRAAFLIVGVPWLALVVSAHAHQFGRMTFYTVGDDWWTFQRLAYRIYLQGYWLEGGERAFWFQPLYRWISGALHLFFGDSSVGEALWDGVCVAFMSLFAFAVVNACSGFRWGLFASALTLVSFMAGPGFMFIGRGLSEISSAGFLYVAALFAMNGRSLGQRCAAGIGTTLGAFTRLNNLPMAAGVLAFAWPLAVPVRAIRGPAQVLKRLSVQTVAVVTGVLVVGFTLFALRTWYYTGTLSVFAGTQISPFGGASRRIWQPGEPVIANIGAIADSVMMVLTTSDPPAFHSGALPVMAGAAIAALSLLGVGPLGRIPLALSLFCLSTLAGALVARGSAYPGRFSIHVIGAAVAVLVCASSVLMTEWHVRRSTVP